jgi:integrase
MTTYAAGLRMSKVCAALQVGDIESAADRMCLKVRQGKGGKDRYTLLSPRLLAALRIDWRDTRSQRWLFPNRAGTGPMQIQTGGVEMWRGGIRFGLSVIRPFRLAVP